MKPSTLALGPHLELQGDVEEEVWPSYLPPDSIAQAVMAVIAMFDFVVVRSACETSDPQIVRFLVGESNRSRLLAIHLDDPCGIVYLLEDDDSDWEDDLDGLKPIHATAAMTVKALIQEGRTGIELLLELHSHQNNRLVSREPSPSLTARELDELVN